MSRLLRHWTGWSLAGVLALMLGGCAGAPPGQSGGQDAGPASATSPPAAAGSGSRAVVEEYLKAASTADGARMYALISASERDDESPQTLGDTARDRYSSQTTWEVLKAEETGSSARVVVDVKGAKVQPNPYSFTLTREAGEWRIVDSPELHEEEKNDRLKIRL